MPSSATFDSARSAPGAASAPTTYTSPGPFSSTILPAFGWSRYEVIPSANGSVFFFSRSNAISVFSGPASSNMAGCSAIPLMGDETQNTFFAVAASSL